MYLNSKCCVLSKQRASDRHRATPLCWTWRECTDLNVLRAICVMWLQMPPFNKGRCWPRRRLERCWSGDQRAHIKLSLWNFTSAGWRCARGSTPPSSPPAPPTVLSHFTVCSPAPGRSSTGWPLWIHLLLLFSTDNWPEQWNACAPLPFETIHHVYFPELSFLLSLSVSHLYISSCLSPSVNQSSHP